MQDVSTLYQFCQKLGKRNVFSEKKNSQLLLNSWHALNMLMLKLYLSLHSSTYDILKFTLRKACTQFSIIKLKNFETKKNLISRRSQSIKIDIGISFDKSISIDKLNLNDIDFIGQSIKFDTHTPTKC